MNKYREVQCECGGRIAVVCDDKDCISYVCVECKNHWDNGEVTPFFKNIPTKRPEGMVIPELKSPTEA
jgi:DNA-directed RNA polymerase subunit RPC12/RpoP